MPYFLSQCAPKIKRCRQQYSISSADRAILLNSLLFFLFPLFLHLLLKLVVGPFVSGGAGFRRNTSDYCQYENHPPPLLDSGCITDLERLQSLRAGIKISSVFALPSLESSHYLELLCILFCHYYYFNVRRGMEYNIQASKLYSGSGSGSSFCAGC